MNTLKKKCFVVCCKSSASDLFIYKCVDSIKSKHPESSIVIVDSDSSNKEYMETYKNDENIFIEDISNKNYEYGAIVYTFKKYKDNYDVFSFIQDSMYLNEHIEKLNCLKNDECLIFREENSGWLYDEEAFTYFYEKHPNFPTLTKNNFQIVLWNSFAINTITFSSIIETKMFSDIQAPINKVGSRYMERVWSILFIKNGINLTVNNSSLHKTWAGRQ